MVDQQGALFVEFGGIGGVYDSTRALVVRLKEVETVQPVDLFAPTASHSLARIATQMHQQASTLPSSAGRGRSAIRILRTTLHACLLVATRGRRYRLISIQGQSIHPLIPLVVIATSRVFSRGSVTSFTPHNLFIRTSRLSAFAAPALRAACRASDVIFAHDAGRGVLDRTDQLGKVIEIPLPMPQVFPRERDWPRRDGATVVGVTLGYLRRDKNLLAIAREINDRRPSSWTLSIAGEAKEPDVACELATLRSAWVDIEIGFLDPARFLELLAGADFILLPYQVGSGSGVLDLAVRVGVPVVATPFAHATDLASAGAAVFLANAYDAGAVIAAVERFLAVDDRECLERIATGRSLVAKRDLRSTDSYARLIRDGVRPLL